MELVFHKVREKNKNYLCATAKHQIANMEVSIMICIYE